MGSDHVFFRFNTEKITLFDEGKPFRSKENERERERAGYMNYLSKRQKRAERQSEADEY